MQDTEYAYWQIPLDPLEQHRAILHMPDGTIRYLVHMLTAQGSRGAALSWSATEYCSQRYHDVLYRLYYIIS